MAPDLAWCYVKFIYSEKVTKFEKKISQFYLQKDLLTSNKIGEFFQILVVFSENMNFIHQTAGAWNELFP